jgi:hypothetical protein
MSKCKPELVICGDHVAVVFRIENNQTLLAHVDDWATALRLVAAGPWHPYPNLPGKEKYLRRCIRSGPRTTTRYAHRTLFGNEAPKPRDGNYFNLRSVNFREPAPRSDEEVSVFLGLFRGALWEEMQTKAFRALRDHVKADDAIAATLDQVIASLQDGKGSFQDEPKFKSWVLAILEAQIRRRRFGGDIVFETDERKKRRTESAEDLLNERSTGVESSVDNEQGSGHLASSLTQTLANDRPARSTPVRKSQMEEMDWFEKQDHGS